LSLEKKGLRLSFRDEVGGELRLPVEDLAYVVVDGLDVTLSAGSLAAMAEGGVLLLGVNACHLPVWTSLPWTEHYRHGEVIESQLQASLPLKKRLWSSIITRKIEGQAEVLSRCRRPGESQLRAMARSVRSGDPDNVEARAAKTYWRHLFPQENFQRHAEDLPNAMLNYGYAVIRAALARQLCAAGFIPQIGLHHRNLTNAYNLADDLIEPYRPLVDEMVAGLMENESSAASFTPAHRRQLVAILERQMLLAGETVSLLTAIEATVDSLRKSLVTGHPQTLAFPEFATS
jgi:CRISPR-associated protein Cas1